MPEMKRIGILGGISHYTTIEYYSRIMNLYKNLYNDINYPEIVIYSYPMAGLRSMKILTGWMSMLIT